MMIGVDASRAAMQGGVGVGRYSRELIAALIAASDHRYTLYANGVERPAWADAPGVTWRSLPWPLLWTHLRLSWELACHAPDALLIPAHVVPAVHPRATVVTIHDLGYLFFPQCHPPLQRLHLRLSTAWSARAAARILADSACTREDLVRHLGVPQSKIDVAYPGVSQRFGPQPAAAIEALRRRYHLPARYLLYLGTLQPRKNLVRLIQAHALVPEAPVLVLAGAAGWRSAATRAAIQAAGDRVRWLGYVPDSDLPALLSGAQALALVSLYEGFGIPVLEAMACGIPVIASSTSSLPEIVGDASILVDPLLVDSIADGIRRLCEDMDMARHLAERGLLQAARFTWEGCARVALDGIERAHADAQS